MEDDSRMLPLSPVYFVPLGLVACGSPFVAIGVISKRKNTAIRGWPRVTGRIVSSALETHEIERRDTVNPQWMRDHPNDVAYTTTCSAAARFTYEVDGKTHESTTISRENLGGTRQEVQAWVDRHPPGTAVSVYVDPRNPTKAYLEWKRWTVGSIILLVWGGVFVFAGLLVLTIFLLVGG